MKGHDNAQKTPVTEDETTPVTQEETTPEAQETKPAKKGGKILFFVILSVLILTFLVSGGMLLKYYIDSQRSKQTYAQVRDLRGDYTRPPMPTTPDGKFDPEADVLEQKPDLPLTVTVTDPETGKEVQVLRELAEVYKANPDLVGWLTIPGTNIDYPVVQRKESKDHYLYRDFYGKYDAHGCLYVDENCDPKRPSDNVTIYGHRMKDQTMFSHLAKFIQKSFWEENRYLYFDTLDEHHTYEIIYVFTTTASVGEGFLYHQFIDAASAEEFNSFLVSCSRNSLYDTGLSAQYGDKLVTLSTCEYSQENGRLVIVAKRLD
jgi:sortase B